jgi:hypothetical protein
MFKPFKQFKSFKPWDPKAQSGLGNVATGHRSSEPSLKKMMAIAKLNPSYVDPISSSSLRRLVCWSG